MHWGAIFACAPARAVTSSVLDMLHCHDGNGICSAHEVEGDDRYGWLVGWKSRRRDLCECALTQF